MKNVKIQADVEGRKIEMLVKFMLEARSETEEGYVPVRLSTDRGNIDCRYYMGENSTKAVIFVGGVGGDFDSPANDLYPRLCQDLRPKDISSLRLQYRSPTDLFESTLDVLAGISYLNLEKKLESIGLVGHSFGGAVVIQAAANSLVVKTVITLSTQNYGVDAITRFKPFQSILLLHGENDLTPPSSFSYDIFQKAHQPKDVILYAGAGHNLNEAADEVYRAVTTWLIRYL